MSLRGNRLKELRLKQDLTQEQLAERLSLNTRQIHRYETGETDPAGDILARIATTFNVTTDYLLGLSDDTLGHVTEEDLSPMERRLLATFRSGEFMRMIQMLSDEALANIPKQRDITTDKPVIDG